MADAKVRRLKVLHIVGADGKSTLNPLLLPLLTRGNRQRIETQVIHLARGSARFAVVRQSGIPVHEVALSRQSFSPLALLEIRKLIAAFKPDLINAWGSTAQLLATLLAGVGKKSLPIVWSVTRTAPLLKSDGWLGRTKFKFNMKFANKCKRQVFPSAVASANYRRAGVPEQTSVVISPGIDAERFKPDDAARERVRAQLELPKEAIVVGMYAPFQPEFDHATLLKGIGELTKINPNIYCVLAGRAIARGNSALMAMVGGGTLGTRTRVIGEWTDLGALFNACDVVCSTATVDAARLHLVMAMLCGTMCVATGIGAQGEVLGGFGVSIEPGSPEAVTRGIRRLIEMPSDRKAFMTLEARKHALQNFNMTRSIEKYHELYVELITGEAPAVSAATASTADEAAAQDSKQASAAEIIANRAVATAARANAKPVPAEEKPKVADVEPETSFGSVAAVESKKESIAEVANTAASQDVVPEVTPKVEAKAAPKAELSKANDSIDFESYINAPPSQEKTASDQNSSEDSAHWSEDDAKLMDDVLIEADPTTAKANADKAAGAAKAAAAKSAASAALVAALSAGGDSIAGLDPKLVAALNLGNSSRPHSSAPRAVAGRPPLTPSAVAAIPSAAPSVVAVPVAKEKVSDAKPSAKQNSSESPVSAQVERTPTIPTENTLDKVVGE